MAESLFSFLTVDDLSEFPRLLPGEVICPECNLTHRGECF